MFEIIESNERKYDEWIFYLSAALVRRITWSSVNVGVNWIELVGTPEALIELPIWDDILPIVLNVEPIVAVPLIEDGLYVGIGWNGLRDCVTGSGLNWSDRVDSEWMKSVSIFVIVFLGFVHGKLFIKQMQKKIKIT